jgi:hypothetical protein
VVVGVALDRARDTEDRPAAHGRRVGGRDRTMLVALLGFDDRIVLGTHLVPRDDGVPQGGRLPQRCHQGDEQRG